MKPAPNYDSHSAAFAALIDAYTSRQNGSLRDLLNAYEGKLAAWRKSEESSASDFNVFDTLHIAHDEIRHSMMLEWLLDHRIERAGTHAQGKLGFRFFLRKAGLNMDYAKADYFVSREVKGDSSRVDVEIAAIGQFIIHLENKIFSEEGMNEAGKPDQTVREWEDLQRRARHLGVKPDCVHGFFVTPSGDTPSSKRFTAIKWDWFAEIFDEFAEHAKAGQVSLFAKHYGKALRSMTQQITPHEQHEETNPNSQS